jgi:hypothetical protein
MNPKRERLLLSDAYALTYWLRKTSGIFRQDNGLRFQPDIHMHRKCEWIKIIT